MAPLDTDNLLALSALGQLLKLARAVKCSADKKLAFLLGPKAR